MTQQVDDDDVADELVAGGVPGSVAILITDDDSPALVGTVGWSFDSVETRSPQDFDTLDVPDGAVVHIGDAPMLAKLLDGCAQAPGVRELALLLTSREVISADLVQAALQRFDATDVNIAGALPILRIVPARLRGAGTAPAWCTRLAPQDGPRDPVEDSDTSTVGPPASSPDASSDQAPESVAFSARQEAEAAIQARARQRRRLAARVSRRRLIGLALVVAAVAVSAGLVALASDGSAAAAIVAALAVVAVAGFGFVLRRVYLGVGRLERMAERRDTMIRDVRREVQVLKRAVDESAGRTRHVDGKLKELESAVASSTATVALGALRSAAVLDSYEARSAAGDEGVPRPRR